MATSYATIVNGFITGANGRYVGDWDATHADINGWTVTIDEDGNILCRCEREYSDGLHSIWYMIKKNGFAKLTLSVPGQPIRTLRKGYVLPKGVHELSGEIGLGGGNVDERYAFFREKSFMDFLNKYGITAVKHVPNLGAETFTIRNAWYGGGQAKGIVWSDVKPEWVASDDGRTPDWQHDCPGTSAWEQEESYRFPKATWVIVTQDIDERDNHSYARILYTSVRDVRSLESSFQANPEVATWVNDQERRAKLHKLEERDITNVAVLDSVLAEAASLVAELHDTVSHTELDRLVVTYNGDRYHIKVDVFTNGTLRISLEDQYNYRTIAEGKF